MVASRVLLQEPEAGTAEAVKVFSVNNPYIVVVQYLNVTVKGKETVHSYKVEVERSVVA